MQRINDKVLLDEKIEEKLIEAEQQIKAGKTVKASIIFKELEAKYEF